MGQGGVRVSPEAIVFGGDFERHELIGKGAMGWVYKGRQISMQRDVAIKVMYPHLAEEGTFRLMFEREALGPGGLDHENIVHVYGRGTDSNGSYIAMEYVDGLDLRRWINANGQL